MGEPKPRSTIEWMYEGPSSSLNQEEYLTGKKIEANFDRFHGEESVKPDQQGVESIVRRSRTPPTTGLHGTMLDLRTVKNEDPLVAIKVKEELVRKEILHNPMQMKRLQKLVAKEMEKKMKKMSKHSKRSRSSERRRDSSPRSSQHSHHHHSGSHHHHHSAKDDRPRKRSLSQEKPHHSSDRNREKVDYSDSDSDNERKRKKYQGYGLVNTSKSKPANHHDSSKHRGREHDADTHKRTESNKDISRSEKQRLPEKRPKLTEEEKEQRRREMMDNASWRDKQREQRLRDAREREKREALAEAADKRRKGSDFIRPMLSAAMESGSVEQRIKSNIFSVDRKSKNMNSNFVKK